MRAESATGSDVSAAGTSTIGRASVAHSWCVAPPGSRSAVSSSAAGRRQHGRQRDVPATVRLSLQRRQRVFHPATKVVPTRSMMRDARIAPMPMSSRVPSPLDMGLVRPTRSSRRPRRCSTTISTAACGRRRSSTSPPSSATTACRRPTPTSWRRTSGAAPTASASSSTSRRSPTRSGSCRSATRSSGSPPSAPRTWPPTASCMPRSAMAPELCTERGLTLDEVQDAILEGFRIGSSAAAEAAATRSS